MKKLFELNWRKILILLAILSFLWGVFLRVYELGEQSYWMDEAFSINAAQEIVEKGEPLLDSGEYYDRAYVYHYILAGAMMISDSPAMLRLPSVIFSLLAVLAVFGVARRLFPERPEIAWFTMIIMSLSYFDIAWARQARMYSMLSFLSWMSIFSLFPKKGRVGFVNILLALMFWFLAYDTHKLALLFLPAILLIATNHFPFFDKIFRKIKKSLFLLVAGVLCGLLVFGVFYQMEYQLPLYAYWLFENFYLYILALFLVFVITCFNRKHLEPLIILYVVVSSVLCVLMFFGLKNHVTVSYRYMYFVYPAFYLLFSWFLSFILSREKLMYSKILILFLIVPLLCFTPQSHYALESDNPEADLKYYSFVAQPNFEDAIKEVESLKSRNRKLKFVTSLPAVYKAYTNKSPDYWLETVFANEQKGSYVVAGKDLYTGAKVISSEEALQNLMNKNDLLIMVDSSVSLKKEFEPIRRFLDKNMNLQHVSSEGDWSEIKTYVNET